MSVEPNKATVLRYFLETHNRPYNLDIMDETCSPEFAEAHKRWQRMELSAFPDKHFTIEQVIAEDDKVVLRWTIRATHLGEFWTPVGIVPPTGKQVKVSAIAIFRLEDGKIIEESNVHEWLNLLLQFGAEIKIPGGVSDS